MNLFERFFGKKRAKATPSTTPADYKSTAQASKSAPSRARRDDIVDSPPITMPFLYDTHAEGPTGYDDDSGNTKSVTAHVETSSHTVTSSHDTGSNNADSGSSGDGGGGGGD